MAGLIERTLTIKQMKRLKNLGVDTTTASVVLIYKDIDDNEIEWDDVKVDDSGDFYSVDEFEEEEITVEQYLLDSETGDYDHSYREECGVFTLQDIWEKLPKTIWFDGLSYELFMEAEEVGYRSWCGGEVNNVLVSCSVENYSNVKQKELNLLYHLLCWCAGNGYLETE